MANQYLAQCVQSRLANPAGSGNRTGDSKTADITDGVRNGSMSAEREAMLREDRVEQCFQNAQEPLATRTFSLQD